jgi:excisionase family DNA binding protein
MAENTATERTERPRGRPRYLRVPEVAERLRISRSTCYELISKGHVPALQLHGRGSTILVDEAELEAWIAEEDWIE